MDYYLTLGVPRDADPGTIRRAFRSLVRQYHPDAGEGSSAERFRQIVTAYETLSDPARRGHYDRALRLERAPTPRVVEPLTRRPAPEPLLGRQPRAAPQASAFDLRWPGRLDELDELIDELFRSLDDPLVGQRRRCGWF